MSTTSPHSSSHAPMGSPTDEDVASAMPASMRYRMLATMGTLYLVAGYAVVPLGLVRLALVWVELGPREATGALMLASLFKIAISCVTLLGVSQGIRLLFELADAKSR